MVPDDSGDLAVCGRSQLAARIDVRSSREFYDTLRGAAKRAQLSVSITRGWRFLTGPPKTTLQKQGESNEPIRWRDRAESKAKELAAMAEKQKEQRAETHKRMINAKRAASINVRSTPVRAAPKSLDDDLRARASRVYGT